MPHQRLLLLFALLSTGAHAQWLNYPNPGTPRLPDGKANLAAPAPRALDGKPDLSGVWHVQPTSLAEMERLYGPNIGATNVPGMEIDTISKYALNIFVDLKPADVPIRPETAEALKRRSGADALGTCLPAGVPIDYLVSEPNRMVQSPRLMVILYETDGMTRQIHTDGRTLPKEIEQPAWFGYSAGRWEGDTLVVESAGFNSKTSLDLMGHPHSEALRIVERYHRRDFGHMDVEMTFDDPQMYTKPFSIKFTEQLWPDTDVFEYVCNENEKDSAHERK
jgi:hypothetical protein